VGTADGKLLGVTVDGLHDSAALGAIVGRVDKIAVGAMVGSSVGTVVGTLLGKLEGT
jgi:phage tail tape-measure protein